MEVDYIVAFVTVPSKDEAEKISKSLLEERLVACANIVEKVHSSFWWQGKIDSATEALLLLKTKYSLVERLQERIKELHSYDVPEIIALPIISGQKDYLNWINESVC